MSERPVDRRDVASGSTRAIPCRSQTARPDATGEQFIRGQIRVPMYARVYDPVSITDALAVRLLRPRIVFMENVAAIAAAGELGRAVGDLAALGYDAQWRCVSAADVGAPHRRDRIFVVADPEGVTVWPGLCPRRSRTVRDRRSGDGGRSTTADPDEARLERRREGARREGERIAGALGLAIRWAEFEPAIRRWERLTRPAPAPMHSTSALSGAFTEWLMGYPPGWITDTPGVSNSDALRLCGNGVVPLRAAEALRLLLADAQRVAA